MVKIKAFKKLAALTAAIALVGSFAVSASAVSVSTTTSYVAGSDNEKVQVVANITADPSVEVTYYATKANGDVFYLNQDTTDGSGNATFTYVTDEENLECSVLLGQTEQADADTGVVDGYTISYDGIRYGVVPTTNAGTTVVIPYTLDENMEITDVVATNSSVTSRSYSAGSLTVVLGTVSADSVITVTAEETEEVIPATGSYVDGAILVVTEDTVTDEIESGSTSATTKVGDRKLTVLGQVNNSDEYGIIISTGEVASTLENLDGLTKFQAKGKNTEGYFAVQVIDVSDEVNAPAEVLIDSDTTYKAYVYYKNGDVYNVVGGSDVTPQ